MRVTIIIETESISELYQHLTVIRHKVRSECRKQKLDPLRDEFERQEWEDTNCYGEHIVKVRKSK